MAEKGRGVAVRDGWEGWALTRDNGEGVRGMCEKQAECDKWGVVRWPMDAECDGEVRVVSETRVVAVDVMMRERGECKWSRVENVVS
jgi:hypothetical protein